MVFNVVEESMQIKDKRTHPNMNTNGTLIKDSRHVSETLNKCLREVVETLIKTPKSNASAYRYCKHLNHGT